MSTTSGSSKRARAPSSGGSQVASCLVDGCNSDLSKCRDYHRRHKVCELHSKTPKVTIGGQEQRFCQQCSRFHSLMEFDEVKRSCRKRLEGHNRRRRKPPPEPLSNPGNFLSSGQGSRFIPFSSSAIITPTSLASSTWSGAIKAETDPSLCGSSRSQSISASYSHAFRGRQFPFLQGSDPLLPGSSSAHQQLHDPSSIPGTSSSSNPKTFCNRLTQVINESDRALSLLSSSPAAETNEISLSHVMHQPNHPMASARPLFPSLHYSGVAQYPASQGLEEQRGVSGLMSSVRSNSTNLHCQDIFQAGHEGSSASGPHQTLSFSWE
ncbi:hypothetical protein Ancab_020459 [Ancistrocladus abbreviatus]